MFEINKKWCIFVPLKIKSVPDLGEDPDFSENRRNHNLWRDSVDMILVVT